MKRLELEHVIRAATSITNEYEMMIIGSQSILGSYPNAPEELLQSNEVDIYPLRNPELADLIEGSIGEMSPFMDRFGYYAQGVGPETAILPNGWQDRLIKIQNENTNQKIGYCLDPNDLAVSKLAAGRDKDWPFVECMLKHHLIDYDVTMQRLVETQMDGAKKALAILRLSKFKSVENRDGPASTVFSKPSG